MIYEIDTHITNVILDEEWHRLQFPSHLLEKKYVKQHYGCKFALKSRKPLNV